MSLLTKSFEWLDDRAGVRRLAKAALDEPVPGGASFAYVFGSVLTFIFVLQATTGIMLAFYYSPSGTDAWASVAYIQGTVTAGWFIRGLHSYGASAMVIVAGLHLLQTALYGAYKKPRELNWIVGVLMLGLILAFALTGYLLPWDQKGYWATKVATGIAGTSPLIGEQLQYAVQGGNEYGNLTLTRFFAIHVFILPTALIGLIVVHIALFRRHGVTPSWNKSAGELEAHIDPFWPNQVFKDMVAMAVVFAILMAVNLSTHGVELLAPADPSGNFDARPEWYFRALFQMLKYFHGPMEMVVSLGIPPVVGGFLVALPFLDRGASRSPLARAKFLAVLGAGIVAAGALTVVSFTEDAADSELQERIAVAEERAELALELARANGVPPAGGLAVFTTAEHYFAKEVWAEECSPCHRGKERKGPELGPGYNSRDWIHNFLLDPSGDLFFGLRKEHEMDPVEERGEDLEALVELVYAQTGAKDADLALAEKGMALFEDGDCSNCHSLDEESEGDDGPNLWRRGSLDMLTSLIGTPGHPRWFGASSEMTPYIEDFNRAERTLLARYILSWQAEPYEHGRTVPGPVKAKTDDDDEGGEGEPGDGQGEEGEPRDGEGGDSEAASGAVGTSGD